MPDDGRRYELLGGSIVVHAASRPRHQLALSAVNDLVKAACPSGHAVVFAPIELDLPGGQRVEPDLVVVPRDDAPVAVSTPLARLFELPGS